MEKIGQRLKRLREKKGLSRRQLENLAEIPHGVISRLERDERTAPSMKAAMSLAKVLGVSLDYLCGMYEEEDKESTVEPAPA